MRGLVQAVAISYMPQNKEIPTVAMLLRNDDLLYTPKVYNSEKEKEREYQREILGRVVESRESKSS